MAALNQEIRTFCSRRLFGTAGIKIPHKQGCEEALHRMHSSRFKS